MFNAAAADVQQNPASGGIHALGANHIQQILISVNLTEKSSFYSKLPRFGTTRGATLNRFQRMLEVGD